MLRFANDISNYCIIVVTIFYLSMYVPMVGTQY